MTSVDVVVLGAGAAGLMCAIESSRRGRRTLVLERADRPGKKILISGGGRCNFTNLNAEPENYLSANPHFARSALARYTPQDFLAMVEAHRIPWHEKHLGQLFCDNSAQDILTMLIRECVESRARIMLSTEIYGVTKAEDRFRIDTSKGPIEAESVVVATGGLSIPKLGATGFGYELARAFGLAVVPRRPALVPFVLTPEDQARWCDLTGVSTGVVASVEAAPAQRRRAGAEPPRFREKLLVTHRGLSGPAVLQISSYWAPGREVVFDLAPGEEVFAGLRSSTGRRDWGAVTAAVRAVMPGRLAERWLSLHAPEGAERNLPNAVLGELEEAMHTWRICPAETEGYAKAEVTAGGVSTDELDPRTLESRKFPGLYFIGEVVDVTGWLGGYNFQWAWASGFCAGQSA